MRAGIVAEIMPEYWEPISVERIAQALTNFRELGACSPRCPGCKQRTLERRVRPKTHEIHYVCHNVAAHRDDPQCGYYQLPALLKSIQEDAAIAAGRSPSPR